LAKSGSEVEGWKAPPFVVLLFAVVAWERANLLLEVVISERADLLFAVATWDRTPAVMGLLFQSEFFNTGAAIG